MRLIANLAAITLLVLGLITACAQAPDSQLPPPAGPGFNSTAAAPLPVPRSEVAGVAWQGRLVVAGGFLSDGGSSGQVDAWRPDGGWERLPDLPEPRNHAGAAVHADRLHVVGGYDQGGRASARVWSLGDGEDRWRAEPMLPAPRAAAVVVSDGQRLVVAGGVVDGAVSSSAVVFGAGRWTSGPPLATAREHPAGASSGGRVYALAGRTAGLDSNLDVVESLGPGESSWRPEPSLPVARGGTSADTVNGVVCIAGGEDPAGTEPVVLCLRGGAWEVVGRLTEPRHGLAVVALSGALHVVAGGPLPGLTVSGAHEILAVR